MREGVEVWRGKIGSLKRFKDDVSEVRQGVECGIDLAGFKDIRVGDSSSRSPPMRTPGRRAGPELRPRPCGGGCGCGGDSDDARKGLGRGSRERRGLE
jgi:hypothetical protein